MYFDSKRDGLIVVISLSCDPHEKSLPLGLQLSPEGVDGVQDLEVRLLLLGVLLVAELGKTVLDVMDL